MSAAARHARPSVAQWSGARTSSVGRRGGGKENGPLRRPCMRQARILCTRRASAVNSISPQSSPARPLATRATVRRRGQARARQRPAGASMVRAEPEYDACLEVPLFLEVPFFSKSRPHAGVKILPHSKTVPKNNVSMLGIPHIRFFPCENASRVPKSMPLQLLFQGIAELCSWVSRRRQSRLTL